MWETGDPSDATTTRHGVFITLVAFADDQARQAAKYAYSTSANTNTTENKDYIDDNRMRTTAPEDAKLCAITVWMGLDHKGDDGPDNNNIVLISVFESEPPTSAVCTDVRNSVMDAMVDDGLTGAWLGGWVVDPAVPTVTAMPGFLMWLPQMRPFGWPMTSQCDVDSLVAACQPWAPWPTTEVATTVSSNHYTRFLPSDTIIAHTAPVLFRLNVRSPLHTNLTFLTQGPITTLVLGVVLDTLRGTLPQRRRCVSCCIRPPLIAHCSPNTIATRTLVWSLAPVCRIKRYLFPDIIPANLCTSRGVGVSSAATLYIDITTATEEDFMRVLTPDHITVFEIRVDDATPSIWFHHHVEEFHRVPATGERLSIALVADANGFWRIRPTAMGKLERHISRGGGGAIL